MTAEEPVRALILRVDELLAHRELPRALDAARRAVDLAPRSGDAHNALGKVLGAMGRPDEARRAYERSVECDPGSYRAHANLSALHSASGDPRAALSAIVRATELAPDLGRLFARRGRIERELGLAANGLRSFERAFTLEPTSLHRDAYARSLVEGGDLERAIELLDRASDATRESWTILAHAFEATGRARDLARVLRRLLESGPLPAPFSGNEPDASALTLRVLGEIHASFDRLDEAVTLYERALALEPTDAEVVAGLAVVYGRAGLFDRARALGAEASRLAPAQPFSFGFFFDLHDPTQSPEVIRDRLVAWAARFAVVEETIELGPTDPDPGRRLRVAYLSPDFREHAVMRFALPIFRHHDPEAFEIHCFGPRVEGDPVAEEVRRLCRFHDTTGSSLHEVAESIAREKIDVAIDLAGHTTGSLVHVFSHRVSSVQATYVGWPATTGMAEVDVRITDPIADPPGRSEQLHTEELCRLHRSAWCFSVGSTVEVLPRPRDQRELVLGSFNRATKLSDELLGVWARLLSELPSSKLLLKGQGLSCAITQQRIRRAILGQGVGADRLMMTGWSPDYDGHLQSWSDVDIALDSYPYAGTTTTCEALWMGVPVVTRCGDSHVSRVGASLLTAVGMGDLVARDWDEYVDIVIALAGDPDRRARMREELRARVRASSLGSAESFTRDFEGVLRSAWRSRGTDPASTPPPGSRLCRVGPRRFVGASLRERDTFVALEQGYERGDEWRFVRGLSERRSDPKTCHVVADSTSDFARGLAWALEDERTRVVVSVPPRLRVWCDSSLALHDVGDRVLVSDDAFGDERSDVMDVSLGSALQILARQASITKLVHVRLTADSDGAALLDSARDRGLEVWRVIAGGTLVRPVSSMSEVDPLSLAVLVAGREAQDEARSRGLVASPHTLFRGGPAVELRAEALVTSDPSVRAALLDLALEASSEHRALDPAGGALTAARLALETGRPSRIEPLLLPLLDEPRAPLGPFVGCLPSHDASSGTSAETGTVAVLQALEGVVLRGKRSSFDAPVTHRALLTRYFREGGFDPEMNRRYGLLLAIGRRPTAGR